MNLRRELSLILRITRSPEIARRYFVVNGFDGALTMLGLVMGFYVSGAVDISVVVTACMGAAIALGISGLTSAYISEAAERKKELRELENAMVEDLKETAYGQASRLVPLLIGLVNALSPFLISLVIIMPLWLALAGMYVPFGPLESAILLAFFVIFWLGVFIGKVGRTFWLWAGLRTVLIALVTAGLIYLLGSL